METNSVISGFVKAIAQPDRLCIMGVLAQNAASTQDIATALGIPEKYLFQHLSMLEQNGIIHKLNQVWELDVKNIEDICQQQFKNYKRETFTPASELYEKSRKILTNHLNPDGSIKQLPSEAGKLQVILEYLLQAFDTGNVYTEKEVNQIIRRYHTDTAGLRRDLIDRGMLQRKSDGSQYWRPA